MTLPPSLADFVFAVKDIARRSKRWAKRYHRVIGAIVLLWVLPSWISRTQFWYQAGVYVWPHAQRFYDAWYGRLFFVILGIALLIFPWHRFRERHDLATLKGRTLQLRDEIQAFLNSAPPTPTPRSEGESQEDYLRRSFRTHGKRFDYLANGYAWRFHDRMQIIHFQFGECGLLDGKLNDVLARPIKNEECYAEIIAGLTRLSEHPEGATGISNSGYEHMPIEDFMEGRNRGVF